MIAVQGFGMKDEFDKDLVGAIRTKACIELEKKLPDFSGIFIIDQDKSVRSMLEDLKAGYENICRMLEN